MMGGFLEEVIVNWSLKKLFIQQIFVTHLPWAQGYIHQANGVGQFG